MKEKVYEMDENYQQAVADLLEFIKLRDEAAEAFKIAPPEKRLEGQLLLAEMDKKIEDCEAALAAEYEATQNELRAEEESDKLNDEIVERMAMVYIHIKYNHPDKLDEIKAAATNGYTPDEEKKFFELVAHLEATQLEEIIAQRED